MKKVKMLLIYGIIGILVVISLVSFIMGNMGKAQPYNAQVNAAATSTTVQENGKTTVGIALGSDYAETTRQAIKNAGGLQGIVKKGDTVLIKPNLCTDSTPDSPLTTDYRVVQEIVDEARDCGAGRIIIAEGPIMGLAFSEGSLKRTGYGTIKDVEFYEFNNITKDDCYKIKPENSLTNNSLYIPKIYMDADVVIGAPKLKTHGLMAYISISLKNLIGVAPGKIYGTGGRNALHSMGLNEAIVDLNKIRKPDFLVVDGIVGGEGKGPLTNKAVQSNIVIAGTDPVAVDTVGLTFMGFSVDDVAHVKLAAKEGIGTDDLGKINVVGANLDEIKAEFRRPF